MTTAEREEIRDLRRETREDIAEIKSLIGKLSEDVNKRLGRLELWRARSEGVRAAFSWLPALAAGAIGSGIGALVALLIAH